MNLHGLAQALGLSPSAISLALRDSPKISAATKERVRRLAREMGYQPDPRLAAIMRNLRKPAALRQTACFGVISFYEEPRPWERSIHQSRVFDGMNARAGELGYRLEHLFLKAPGMSYRRFSGILEARGIDGLLCFGSPVFNQDFPPELDSCAVVVMGRSMRTPLHRVMSHTFHDTAVALNRLHESGYRRIGLVLGDYLELRGGHAHSAAYLGWCERHGGPENALPICRMKNAEQELLLGWLKRNEPDAILAVLATEMVDVFRNMLLHGRIRVPRELGVAVISSFIEGSGFDGLQEDQKLMGARMVELLASCVADRNFGIPAQPHIELVEGCWINGQTLRVRDGFQRPEEAYEEFVV